jgi:hypothetical protein
MSHTEGRRLQRGLDQHQVFGDIPLKEGLRNGPYSLRCDFSVTYFCLPPFKCLFTGHSPDCFRDPIDCRFTSWIPGFLPQFL